MSTVVGSSFHISGELHSEEPVAIFGSLQGRLIARDHVVVHPQARVEAEVEGRLIEVAGVVQGNISGAERVEIKLDGQVTGNIRAPRITIADGALFRGSVEMER